MRGMRRGMKVPRADGRCGARAPGLMSDAVNAARSVGDSHRPLPFEEGRRATTDYLQRGHRWETYRPAVRLLPYWGEVV